MRITVAAVGHLRAGPLAQLCAEYKTRLPWRVDIREVEEKRPLPAASRILREAELLAQAIPARSTVIALDARGEALASDAFAKKIEAWRVRSGGEIAFAIGGADGLAADFVARADARVAFGALTWPHMLARVMLLEQLYRAYSISTGHPYHRA